MPIIVYGWLLRSLQNIVVTFNWTDDFLIWLFLIVLDQFDYKIIQQLCQKSTTTFCAICWIIVKLTWRRTTIYSIFSCFLSGPFLYDNTMPKITLLVSSSTVNTEFPFLHKLCTVVSRLLFEILWFNYTTNCSFCKVFFWNWEAGDYQYLILILS